MIWPDFMIRDWARHFRGIEPFEPACVNPASVDLRIGHQFISLNTDEEFEANVLVIRPGHAYLATTIEYIRMPEYASGVVYLKSSMARRGLDHSLAGYVDPKFEGQLTLEIHAHRPVELRAGQRVVQLVLYEMMHTPLETYNGRYQGQRGPTRERGNP